MNESQKSSEELQKIICERTEEFKLLQHAYSTLNTKYNFVAEIFKLILHPSLDIILEKIGDIIIKAIEVESASILLIDSKTNELYFKVAKGPKGEEVKKFRLNVGEGIVGWVAQQNEPLAISDVLRDVRFKKEISEAIGYEVRSVLCVPVQIKGKVLGAIEVLNKTTSDIFVSDDIDLLSSLAQLTAIIIESKR